MPDRIILAAESLRAQAAELHNDVVRFKRSQRIKNILLAVALVGVFALGAFNMVDRNNNDNETCARTNSGRAALREADAARGDGLIEVIRPFVSNDSENGRAFLAELERDNERIKAELAEKLPPIDCT
jgi:hypothetical protein